MVGLFWEAARPKTLGAGVVCVLVGTAAAGSFIAWRFVAAMVASVAVQVAVNYANDYFDAVKGVDTVHRTGPRRVTSAGLVTPGQMRLATGVALGVASVPGLALAKLPEQSAMLAADSPGVLVHEAEPVGHGVDLVGKLAAQLLLQLLHPAL